MKVQEDFISFNVPIRVMSMHRDKEDGKNLN